MARKLFICSYDIRHPKRLRRALKVLKRFSGGGQYSVFECYLSPSEKTHLLDEMDELMAEEDHFLIMPLRRSLPLYTLGAAVKPMDDAFYFVA